MLTYIARRLLWGIVVLILVSLIVFFTIRLLPGDPLLIYLADSDNPKHVQEQLDGLGAQYGLTSNLLQYVSG